MNDRKQRVESESSIIEEKKIKMVSTTQKRVKKKYQAYTLRAVSDQAKKQN